MSQSVHGQSSPRRTKCSWPELWVLLCLPFWKLQQMGRFFLPLRVIISDLSIYLFLHRTFFRVLCRGRDLVHTKRRGTCAQRELRSGWKCPNHNYTTIIGKQLVPLHQWEFTSWRTYIYNGYSISKSLFLF